MNEYTCAPGEPSQEEVAATFRRLRALKKELRPHLNSNQLAIEMIKVIISEGWNTGPRIVGTMKRLGFNAQHAGATLGNNQGSNPKLYYWRRDESGHYTVHEEDLTDAKATMAPDPDTPEALDG